MNNRQAVDAANQRRTTWQPDNPGHGVGFLTDLHLVRYANQHKAAEYTDDAIPRHIFATLGREYRVAIDGEIITVPAGFATDLASVPRRLRGIVSIDRGIEAAVVHDWLYRMGIGTRAEADLIFKRILLETESAATANVMYWGVRVGGGASWQGA